MASYVYDSTDSYPFSSVDNGFTYTPATSTEDFGAVNVAATSQESYDTVTVRQGNDTPYGFATVNGTAAYYKPKKYIYSSSSDNLYTSEDNGLISNSSTSTDDYGTLTSGDGISVREDRYLIITNQSILAMEPGYTYSSVSALVAFVESTDASNILFSINGSSSSRSLSYWVGTGTPFEIGGSSNEIIKAFSSVGTSGPLRLDITSLEVFSKNYAFDAAVPFNILDYGSLGSPTNPDVDFGFVSQATSGGEKDYGLITNNEEVTPFGLYETNGNALEAFSKETVITGTEIVIDGFGIVPVNAVIVSDGGELAFTGAAVEKNTEDYVGTGSLFTVSGAAEVFGANPSEDFALFDINGTAVEKNTERYIGNSIVTSTISTYSNKINTNSFVGVSISGSGTGTGSTGGFNIGNHFKFNGVGARRFDLNPLDVRSYNTISFTVIRGNDVNGGEDPDTTTESLVLQYSINGGSTYTNIGNIVTYNDTTFNSLKNVSLVIPSIAKTSSTIFRISQSASSGTGFDNYGITEISLTSSSPTSIVFSGAYSDLKFTSGAGETTQLFALSGAAVEKNTEDYVGTGSASINVVGVEKNTEAYVAELADVTDLFASYGDLTAVTESEDYGLITQSATNVDYRYLTSDYYDITGAAVEKFIAQTPEDFSLFTFSGTAVEKFVAQTPEDTQLFQFTGAAVEKNTEDYVASGTFSTFSGAAESVTYRYSFDSFVPFTEFDYGSVTQSPTNEIDLGNVSAPITGGEKDYGSITFDDEVVPYGLWTTSGFGVDIFSKNIVDNGGTITLSGGVILPLAVSIIGGGSTTLNGSAVEKNTENYVGTGNLFTASGAAEVFGANPQEDFALFDISGIAAEKFRANPPEDFAQFTFSGVAVEKFTTQGGESTQLFIISGAATNIKNTESYVGTGSTEIDVTKIEKNTESYTVAQADIAVLVDYGDIRESAGSTEDFGLITSTATEFETVGIVRRDYLKLYGYGIEKLVSQTPEDFSLFTFSGATVEKFTAQTPEQTVTFTYTGNAVEKNTESYIGTGQATFNVFSEIRKTAPAYQGFGFAFTADGSAEVFGANPPENVQLFQISGSATTKTNPKYKGEGTISIDITSVEKNTESYVGTGTLFEFIDSDESRTYVYDLNDAVPFTELDYGFISGVVSTENDYGTVAGAFSGGEVDYGTVIFTGDVLPFGSITLSGAAIESFSPQTPESTQIFVISGAAVEKNTESYEGTGSQSITGSAVEKNTEDYVGTGSLFTASGAAEVFGANPTEDFSLFDINGTAVEKFRANPPEDFAQFTFSGVAVEKFTTQGGEDTHLFTLGGYAVERNTESYIGTGTLFEIVDKVEKFTYDYTVSQSELLIVDDYGLIIDVVTSSDDYESIDIVTSQTTEYGLLDLDFLNIRGTASESFGEGLYTASGTITIGGSARDRGNPRWVSKDGVIIISGTGTVPLSVSEIGSGNLFTASGAAEVFGANPTEDFALFDINGTAVEKFRANPPEDFAQFTFSGVAVESTRFNPPENAQNISVSGVVVDATSVSEVGTGSLFTASGAAEVFGANPTTAETQLFIYTGTAVEKNTEVYIGTGFTSIDVTHTMRFVPNWIGNGTIQVDVDSTERNTESYVGSGNAFAFIDSEERRTYDYTVEIPEITSEYRNLIKDATTSTEDYGLITSAATEFIDNGITVRDYIKISPTSLVRGTPRERGTGSLFTASGAAEVFGVNPPENTHLFVYSGAATDIKHTESWVGTGSEILSGAATEKNTDAYHGSGAFSNIGGSIFFIGYYPYTDYITFFTSGAASYKEVNAFNGTGNTEITGAAIDTNTESYVGTGTLFGFGGGAEARTYAYGDFVVLGFNEVDYQFIIENATIDIDYGFVSAPPISGLYDWGYIRFEETTVSGTGQYTFSGSAVESNTESYVGTGSTSIDVFSTERNTEAFNGSGNLFTTSGAAEVFGANPPEDFSLFTLSGVGNTREIAVYTASASGTTTLSGAAVEKNTERYVGDNPTFAIDVFSTEKNTEAFAGTGTETLSGTLVEKNTESYVGTGVVSALSGAAEAFGANPPEDFSLFTYTGTATEKNTESYVGVGTTTIDVSHIEKNTEVFVGSGTETLSGVAVEKNTESYVGTGVVSALSGAAEAFGAKPPESTQLFIYSGAAVEKNTESYVGVGTATTSGVCVEKNTEAFVGSGSISALSGAAESLTVNPSENTHLFVSSGVAETRVIYLYRFQTDGQGTYTISVSHVERNTEAYVGTGSTTASGVGVEKNTETFTGSGELFTYNGAAESRTVNPEEDVVLYTFVGTATEKNTESWVGTGTETLSGTAKEKNTEAYVGTGTTTASGVGLEKNTEVYIGTGSISTLSGAAEAFGVNPPENTHLFVYSGAATERNTEAFFGSGTETISGAAVEKNTESYVGTGFITALSGAAEAFSAQTPENTVLFTFSSSASEAFVAQPPENTHLFIISGAAVERNTEAHFGTGTATLSGTAVEKNTEAYNGTGTLTASGVGLESFSPVYVGSGQLFTYTGAAEAFGANPPEDTSLFTFSGSSVVLNIYKEVGTGTEFVTGTAVEKNTESYVGTGELFNYNGAAESFTVQPTEDTVLFTFVGSASESFTSQGGETTQLFTISGAAVERNTEAYNGTGTETLSGVAYAPLFKSYIASGSLFATNGAAEAFGANPPENIHLFNLSGFGAEKNTEKYYSEGYIYIQVDSTSTQTNVYNGSGSIFNLNGAAEAFGANPPENVQLFTYSGAATEKNTESYVGLCDIAVDVFSVEKNTEAYNGTGTATLAGTADQSNTESYVATGSLFAISGAAEAFGANPTENTVLYTFTGAATEKNIESYEGSGSLYNVGSGAITRAIAVNNTVYVTISGDSDDARARVFTGDVTAVFSGFSIEEFVPGSYRGRGKATINVSSSESHTSVFTASGSLFGFGGAAEATTNVAESNIFATISGTAVTIKSNIVVGSGSILAFSGAAQSISRNPEEDTNIFVVTGNANTINNPYRPGRTYVSII